MSRRRTRRAAACSRPGRCAKVADTIGGGAPRAAALDEPEEPAPLLRELAAAIDPALAPLAEAIERAIEDDGSDLRDNASPQLRKLRGRAARPAGSA